MSNREEKQEVLKSWLLQRPGHLKTNYNRLGEKFDLSYRDVQEVVQEVKDHIKMAKFRAGRYIPDPIIQYRESLVPQIKFDTGNALDDANLRKELFEYLLSKGVLKESTTPLTTKENTTVRIEPFKGGDPNNVLIIGDTHIPFERKGYLEHCRKVQEQYNCGTVVHIGDVIDNNYSSYHETNPDGKSAGDELEVAVSRLQDWYYTFPQAKVCLGNHDQIIQRKAFTAGLSKRWIKGLAEVLQVPNWEFEIEHHINDVIYTHGTGTSGDRAAFTRALNRRRSVVSGHLHTAASITWNVSEVDRIFAMQVGCGIDDNQYSFDYAKAFSKKSIVSCGVVLNGKLPIVVPMEL